MPNWCNNTINITGPKDKITNLFEQTKKDNGLLQAMYPMPKELDDTTSPAPKEGKPQPLIDGFDNWYDWRVHNWGSKWDVDIEGLELSDDGTRISGWFDSAWSPPIGAYEQFLVDNENCSLVGRYYEGGCDFMGIWDNGDDRCYQPSNYNSDSKFFESGDGWELDDYFGITESMAEWEAEQEAEKEDVHEYVKGNKINIGEEA